MEANVAKEVISANFTANFTTFPQLRPQCGRNCFAYHWLPEDNKTILASEYKLYLPTTEQLVGELNEAKGLVKKVKRIKK